jgi:hypothetical protein
MENKTTPKLSLKKETITRLNDDQLAKFVGGTAAEGDRSCENASCNSQANSGSCSTESCNCDTKTEEVGLA